MSTERCRDQAEMKLRQRVYQLLAGEMDGTIAACLEAGVKPLVVVMEAARAASNSVRADAERLGGKFEAG